MNRERTFNKRDALKRKAERGGRAFGGESYLVLPEGVELFAPEGKDYKMDILPYIVSDAKHPDGVPAGETWYTRPFMTHRDIGVNKDRIVCPRSFGKPCPVCEDAERLSRDAKNKELCKGLWPRNRALYNIVILGKDEPVVQVIDYSTFLFGELLEKRVAQDLEERGDFFELVGGCTLLAAFEEDKGGGFTSFPCVSIDFKKRPDYGEEVLESVVDLDTILVLQSYDEIMAKFQGVEDGEAVTSVAKEQEPEEPPRRTLKRQVADPAGGDELPGLGKNEAQPPARSLRRSSPPQEQPKEQAQKPAGEAEEDVTVDNCPEGMKVCPACEGTRKSSRGNPCFICNAKGYVEDKKDGGGQQAPAAGGQEEQPVARRRRRVPAAAEGE